MNICLISKEFPSETGWGGIATYHWELAHGLVKLGNQVDVISMSGKRIGSRVIAEGLRCHRVPACFSRRRIPRAVCGRLRRFPIVRRQTLVLDSLLWSLGAALALRRLTGDVNIDVVECPEILAEGLLVKTLTDLPLLVKLHTPFELQWTLNGFAPTGDTRRVSALEQRTLRRADCVTSCSAALADLLQSSWQDMPQVEVVPNPVDHRYFKPRPNVGSRKALVVGYFGRLEQRKGVDVLFKAFQSVAERISNVQLWLVGADTVIPDDKVQRSWGEKIRQDAVVSGMENQVRLVGKVNRAELPALYCQCDVCVIPSKQFENFPYTCLEAMACGIPVIASACGGIPEMVENGVSGILVKPGDADALSEAMVDLLLSVDKRTSVARKARRRIEENFTRQRVSSMTIEHYSNIIARGLW